MQLVSRLALHLRRQWLTIVLGAIAAVLAVDFAVGPLGLRDLMALRARRTQLEATHRQLLSANAALKFKLERLRTDDHYLERRIREQLGYVRADELVYRFATDPSAADR